MSWAVVYYKTRDGQVPGVEFLESCPVGVEAKMEAVLTAVAGAPPTELLGRHVEHRPEAHSDLTDVGATTAEALRRGGGCPGQVFKLIWTTGARSLTLAYTFEELTGLVTTRQRRKRGAT